jgi:D-alanine-D-alanine ligase
VPALPLFVKPVAAGTSIGVSTASLVRSLDQLAASCALIWEQCGQPALIESFLPGREVTVGITGTGADARTVGPIEIRFDNAIDGDAYSYVNKKYWEGRIGFFPTTGAFNDEAEELALNVWRVLGCRDGGRVDLRENAQGRLEFIEVNPLAGLNPHFSDLCIACRINGIPYVQLIQAIMESALKRVMLTQDIAV